MPQALETLPNAEAVVLVRTGEGHSAWLARTAVLRRRLARLFREPAAGKMVSLRGIAESVHIWLSGSRFESALLHYAVARRNFPGEYRKLIRLHLPAWVRLTMSDAFPRTVVTTHPVSRGSLHYGPFRSRAAAELFQAKILELFPIRRCDEELRPDPAHPGCIYGEMGMCLRPCQLVVSIDEYRGEASRVAAFLESDGTHALASAIAARDRLSEEMDFESAAREHRRIERIESMLAAREGLAGDLENLHGIVVTRSVDAGAVALWPMHAGWWQSPIVFPVASDISLDRRLRELLASAAPWRGAALEREEHVALLARWFYSSWREGEWIGFRSVPSVPWRKLVRAISKVHAASRITEDFAGSSEKTPS